MVSPTRPFSRNEYFEGKKIRFGPKNRRSTFLSIVSKKIARTLLKTEKSATVDVDVDVDDVIGFNAVDDGQILKSIIACIGSS